MKKLVITTIFMLTLFTGLAQNAAIAYHDAIYIKDSCYDAIDGQLKNRKTLISILKKYNTTITDNTSGVDLITKLKDNPLLKPYAPDGFSNTIAAAAPEISFASIGNTDVTKFADGMAKFIVERTKKELQAAFFDRFIEEMKKDKYKDIHKLFPKTLAVINNLPTAIYSYEPYIDSLRKAFGEDLVLLFPHLEDVIIDGQYKDFFNNHKELKSVCLTSLHFGGFLKNGKHIGVLIEEYDAANTKYDFSDANINTIKTDAILFIQEVSKSLKVKNNSDEYWVKADDIKLMIDDPVTFNIYLGLLYEKVKTIKIAPNSTLTYGDIVKDAPGFKTLIVELVASIKEVQADIKNIQSKPIKEVTMDEFVECFDAAANGLKVFKENAFISNFYTGNSGFEEKDKEKIQKFWQQYDRFIDMSHTAFSIYIDLKEKNYSTALGDVTTLYRLCFNPDLVDDKKIDVGDEKKVSQTEVKNRLTEIIEFLTTRGAFITSLAQAKNSDEVYEAIDKFALPVASARVKRLSKVNIALNAYCGFFIGHEHIKQTSDNEDLANLYGLTAPVGFSFSRGGKILPWPLKWSAKGWSSSWFISVIDIGSVAAYRFSNSEAEQVPTIQLKDIVSPGLFWSVGIAKTPISLNLGAQVGPNLRKVNGDTDNEYAKNTYIRYSFSIVVDIPLLNLYTK